MPGSSSISILPPIEPPLSLCPRSFSPLQKCGVCCWKFSWKQLGSLSLSSRTENDLSSAPHVSMCLIAFLSFGVQRAWLRVPETPEQLWKYSLALNNGNRNGNGVISLAKGLGLYVHPIPAAESWAHRSWASVAADGPEDVAQSYKTPRVGSLSLLCSWDGGNRVKRFWRSQNGKQGAECASLARVVLYDFHSPPGPNDEGLLMCGVSQTTELRDNLFNRCDLKKNNSGFHVTEGKLYFIITKQ